MKGVFGKIWLVWSAFKFGITMPFIWLAYQFTNLFYKGDRRYRAFFKVTKFWGNWLLLFIGIRIKKHNVNKNAEGEQVIYISNHKSQIDIPVNFTSTPQFVILSKLQAAKLPVVGTNLRLAHVTVDRKNKESRKNSLLELKEHIKAGRSLLLYPEGKRTRDGLLGDFHDGAFTLASEFNLPIVPVVILGSDKINNPSNPFALFPGVIHVYFLDKLYGNDFNSLAEFKEETRERMENQLKLKQGSDS